MSIFTKVKMPHVGSSKFNLSHDIKLSCNMAELIPTCVMDVIPGDKFRISVENMFRMAPLVSPVMHKVKIKTNFFFVPNRILWDGWEKWITGELDNSPPTVQIDPLFNNGTLADYLGYPKGAPENNTYKANAFPIAAYMKIWDEYYRDENLQPELFQDLISGNNPNYATRLQTQPLKRAWMHDYFTSALPFAQKGDAVTIPILANDQQDVVLKGPGNLNAANIAKNLTGAPQGAGSIDSNPSGLVTVGGSNTVIDPNGSLEVNFTGQVSTIETLRKAFRLQEWLEKNARGGTRYIEHIKAHFGVFSSDKRLQRPEYIGGCDQQMVISEVLSSAKTDTKNAQDQDVKTPVGEMAGHGISVGRGKTFTYYAEEHGFIIGIMSVTPVTAYQQGLHKMLNRPTFLDYYFPSFANLGEQEILNSELYIGSETPEKLDQPFGYIPRYAEYKYMNSRVAGDMKESLSYWHMGRIFSSAPALNADFIECNPTKRIFAVEDPNVDSIYAHIFNNITAIRKMPKYAQPTI